MSVTVAAQTFGELLKYLRRKARLTQRELAQRVGYTEAHVCRLEKNERLPDVSTVAALFIPALELDDEPKQIELLLQLAGQAGSRRPADRVTVRRTGLRQIEIQHEIVEDLGALEDVPPTPPHWVARPDLIERAAGLLRHERRLALVGMAGAGKTVLAAELARAHSSLPVFWLTVTVGVSDGAAAITRALALFCLTQGQTQARPILTEGSGASLPLDQQLNLLRAALSARPVLLCVDDAHLVMHDPAGRALLESFVATTSATLLLTSRERLALSLPQLSVGGLDAPQARSVIVDYGFDPGLPWVEALIERTHGNPMLLRLALGQLGHGTADSTRFVERLASQPQVAAFLMNGVLRRLSASALWLLELVALFRHPIDLFDPSLAELIAGAEPSLALGAAIQSLQEQALIDDVRQAGLHPLLREHLLTQLATDPRRKRRLHRLAAEWEDHNSADVLETIYHAAHAGQYAHTAETIKGREEAVAARGQATAAAAVLSLALRNLERGRRPDRNRRILRDLLTSRGILLVGSLQAREAEADFRRALELTADAPTRADLVARIANSIFERNAYDEALALIAEARDGLGPSETFLRARLAAAAAWAHYDLSHIDEAAGAGEEALALLASFGIVSWQSLHETRATAHSAMASISRARQDTAGAIRHAQATIDAAERGGLRRLALSKRGFLGGLSYDRGDLDEADRLRSEALESATELGDSYTVAYMNMYLTDHDRIRLAIDRGLERLDVVQRLMDQIGDGHGQADQQARRAAFLLWRGDVDGALRLLDGPFIGGNADHSSRSHGYNLNRLAFAQLVADPAQWRRAGETLDRADALPGTPGDRNLRFNLATTRAALWLTAGEPARAVATLSEVPVVEGFGLWGRLERALLAAAASWAVGDRAEANRLFADLCAAASAYPLFAERIERFRKETVYRPERIPGLLWRGDVTA